MKVKRYYKVVVAATPEALAKVVDDEVRKGMRWQPQGGIVAVNDMGVRYYQAMYRKLPKNLEKDV